MIQTDKIYISSHELWYRNIMSSSTLNIYLYIWGVISIMNCDITVLNLILLIMVEYTQINVRTIINCTEIILIKYHKLYRKLWYYWQLHVWKSLTAAECDKSKMRQKGYSRILWENNKFKFKCLFMYYTSSRQMISCTIHLTDKCKSYTIPHKANINSFIYLIKANINSCTGIYLIKAKTQLIR